jgi:hypothetical protein
LVEFPLERADDQPVAADSQRPGTAVDSGKEPVGDMDRRRHEYILEYMDDSVNRAGPSAVHRQWTGVGQRRRSAGAD